MTLRRAFFRYREIRAERRQCYNLLASQQFLRGARSSSRARCTSRGVAQPGRAPGSGPGGRRFKSSLPDQSFQVLKLHFWFSVYIDGVDFVDGHVFLDFPLGFHRELQSDLPARTRLSLSSRTSIQGHCLCPRPFFATDGRSVGHSFSPPKITVIQ
jgi:hypothetical protein